MSRLLLGALLALGAAGCGSDWPSWVTAPSASAPPQLTPRPIPTPTTEAEAVRQPDGTFRWAPVSAPIEQDVPYLLEVMTHCGFTATSFDVDGSYWDVTGPPDDGQGNPRAGIGNPVDAGVFVLVGPDEAVWTSASGIPIRLVRGAPRAREGYPCD